MPSSVHCAATSVAELHHGSGSPLKVRQDETDLREDSIRVPFHSGRCSYEPIRPTLLSDGGYFGLDHAVFAARDSAVVSDRQRRERLHVTGIGNDPPKMES